MEQKGKREKFFNVGSKEARERGRKYDNISSEEARNLSKAVRDKGDNLSSGGVKKIREEKRLVRGRGFMESKTNKDRGYRESGGADDPILEIEEINENRKFLRGREQRKSVRINEVKEVKEKIFDLKNHTNDLLFLPLGGSSEVTMNCNLYHYKGKWIIVDMGVAFTKNIPGVQVILPDIKFIKQNLKDFLGIFITHAHEDHIGAIQYLWEELRLPIYASKFAVTFLKNKLSVYPFFRRVKFIEVPTNAVLNVKPFILEFINLTHSIPEMNAILIRTDDGNIFHTGDWRFEEKPIIGIPTNKNRLRELGNRGQVLAMVCESTNIFSDKQNQTEADLLENLKRIIKENDKGLVVAGIFATNISRIISLAIAARAAGRKIGIVGQAIRNILKVALEMKYLPRDIEFVDEDNLNKIDRNKLFIISTGCQGQENAGLSRLADGTHKTLKLESNDVVIFSASEIPGNEIEITDLYNKLADKGVSIINNHSDFVHISGHYSKSELIEMYDLVKPKISIPSHGDAIKLIEHEKIAKKLGIKSTTRGKNGSVLKINSDGTTENVGVIKVMESVMDGKRKVGIKSSIISEREKLANSGVIVISFIVDEKYRQLSLFNINSIGNYNLVYEKTIKSKLMNLAYKGYKDAVSLINDPENKDKFADDFKKERLIEKEIKKEIDTFIYDNYGKSVLIVINFLKEESNIIPSVSIKDK
ncbi:MAG: ribonuclease J [Rickettsiales bacterium]|jgi:ribonuclease J|nr:ribonuclease J [Rickettsiales bacterium]